MSSVFGNPAALIAGVMWRLKFAVSAAAVLAIPVNAVPVVPNF